DELLRRLAQRYLLGLVQPLALALADTVAFVGDRLHALGEALTREQRHDQRISGGARRNRGKQHGHEVRVMELAGQELEHRHPQKSKLIIFFITMTPMDIQSRQPTSITWPVGLVQSSEMYLGVVR